MDQQSTAIIRREREARIFRARLTLTYRIPHLFRMYRRRRRIRAWRRVARVMIAVVKFKRLRFHACTNVLRNTFRLLKNDKILMFRHYVRTIRAVRRLADGIVGFRKNHNLLLRRQWAAMELYVMLTRPELVLSASELRSAPGIRRLDDEISQRVTQ